MHTTTVDGNFRIVLNNGREIKSRHLPFCWGMEDLLAAKVAFGNIPYWVLVICEDRKTFESESDGQRGNLGDRYVFPALKAQGIITLSKPGTHRLTFILLPDEKKPEWFVRKQKGKETYITHIHHSHLMTRFGVRPEIVVKEIEVTEAILAIKVDEPGVVRRWISTFIETVREYFRPWQSWREK